MARISDLLAAGRTSSFEFFPPKDDAELRRLAGTLHDLQPLEPSFVSVTYRGGPASRQRTHDLVVGMLRTTTLTPMAHLVCAGHTRLELADILVQLRKGGIENLMALGGDADAPPASSSGSSPGSSSVAGSPDAGSSSVAGSSDAGSSSVAGHPGGGGSIGELHHAAELVELARAVGGFSIGVAAHPSGHPASRTRHEDREHLAAKLRRADFAVTQSVFSVEAWEDLVRDLSARGVDKPVIPGIMPVTTLASVARQRSLGADVPESVVARLEVAGDPAAMRAAGIEMATELCRGLLDAGAPGLHFYTLNRSPVTREIHANLGLRKAPL